jgi:uncharacterized protein YjbK
MSTNNPANTEVEVKMALKDWRQIERLLDALNRPEASFTQTNTYLDDTARTLREARIMLRAREIQFPVGAAKGLGKPPVTITAKRLKQSSGGIFVAEEREQVMAFDDWREFEWGRSGLDTSGFVFRWVEEQAKPGRLKIVGKTVNHRWKVRSDPFVLEIDKTVFPDDSIEAEIECETLWPDVAKKHIEELCARLKVDVGPQRKSKYARFLEKTEGISDYPG